MNNYQLEDNEEYKSSKLQTIYENNRVLIWLLAIVLIFILFVAMFSSCSRQNNKSNDSEIITIDFDNDVDSLMIGSSKKITASVSNGKNSEIEYFTSDKDIIDVDKYGLVEGLALGNAKLKATYRDLSGKEYSIERKITVFEGNKNISINSVSFPDGEVLLKLHDSYNLGNKLDVNPISGYIETKTFRSSNANVVSVDEKGKIVALNTGEATISVNVNNKYNSSIRVYVIDEQIKSGIVKLPSEIVFAENTKTIEIGGKYKLEYKLTPNTSTGDYLTWKSSNPAIATVNNNGVIEGIGIGNCTISVSTINGKSARINVAVVSNSVSVEKIELSKSTITLKENETYLLVPSITPSNATNKVLTFTSDNNNVASVKTTDGMNAIIYAYNEGKANITITSSNGKTTKVKVIVTDKDSSDVSYNEGTITVKINDELTPAKVYSNDISYTDPAYITISKSSSVKTVKYCYAPYTNALCTPNVVYTGKFKIPSGNVYRLRIQKFDSSDKEIIGSNNDNYRNGALEYYINTKSDGVYKDIGYVINGNYYEIMTEANNNVINGNQRLDFDFVNTVTDKIKVCYTTSSTCDPDVNPDKTITINSTDNYINLIGNGLWKIRVSEYSSNRKVGVTKTYYLKIQNSTSSIGYTMRGNYYETSSLANSNPSYTNERIYFDLNNNANKLKICFTKDSSCDPDNSADKIITTSTISNYIDINRSGLWKIYVSEYYNNSKLRSTKIYYLKIN